MDSTNCSYAKVLNSDQYEIARAILNNGSSRADKKFGLHIEDLSEYLQKTKKEIEDSFEKNPLSKRLFSREQIPFAPASGNAIYSSYYHLKPMCKVLILLDAKESASKSKTLDEVADEIKIEKNAIRALLDADKRATNDDCLKELRNYSSPMNVEFYLSHRL